MKIHKRLKKIRRICDSKGVSYKLRQSNSTDSVYMMLPNKTEIRFGSHHTNCHRTAFHVNPRRDDTEKIMDHLDKLV